MTRLLPASLANLGTRLQRLWRRDQTWPSDLEPGFLDLVRDAPGKPSLKLYSTYKAVEYLTRNRINGDFLECGVYQGRHIVMMCQTLLALGDDTRDIYLYDTFAGMTEPTALDVRAREGESEAGTREKWIRSQTDTANLWCYAPLELVRRNVLATGYPERRLHFIVGDVRKTIPNERHDRIALLRLDTDWHELTKHELEHLYPKVATSGVVVIDDYGTWSGARTAVDEYLAACPDHPLLMRTSKGERVFLRTGAAA